MAQSEKLDPAEHEERLSDAVHSEAVKCDGCGEEVDMRDCHSKAAVVERWNGHMEDVHDGE